MSECTHGSVTGKPVSWWAAWYWPAALVTALASFFVPYFASWSWTFYGLLAGTMLLAIPEIATLVSGNPQNTFSDWVWATGHITGTQPLTRWTAEHYLLMCCFLFITVNVIVFLCQVAWQWGLVGALLASWLLFHFFFRWWA